MSLAFIVIYWPEGVTEGLSIETKTSKLEEISLSLD
jgi:hypothetical protein